MDEQKEIDRYADYLNAIARTVMAFLEWIYLNGIGRIKRVVKFKSF